MATATSIVEYRLVGGAVGVDQRITVFGDGLVELDERHRRRDCTRLMIEPPEVERLQAALAEIPGEVWSHGPTLAICRARGALRRSFTMWSQPGLSTAYFQLRQGRRSIAAEAEDLTDEDAARALLDEIRVRAVRLAESLQPTGGT